VFVYRSFQVSPAGGTVQEWSLDTSAAGKYVLALLPPPDLQLPVIVYKDKTALTYGANWNADIGKGNTSPIWLFEPAERGLNLIIDATGIGPSDLWFTLVGTFSTWAGEIEARKKYKSHVYLFTSGNNKTETCILNNYWKKDMVVRELIYRGGRSCHIYGAATGQYVDMDIYGYQSVQRIPVNFRLSPGDALTLHDPTSGGPGILCSTHFNYWLVPEGEAAPDYIPTIGIASIPGIPAWDVPFPFLPEWPDVPPWDPWPPEWPTEPPWIPSYPDWPADPPAPAPIMPAVISALPVRDVVIPGGGPPVLPWKDIEGAVSLIGLGPLHAHLLRMDTLGRIRQTDEAVLYNSGKVEKTDTSTTTITPSRPGSRLSLKAATLGWEIKVLTLYDVLAGNDFSSAETIYLDAGDSFSEPLEVVQLQVSCPSASGSSTGKLYYYVGI